MKLSLILLLSLIASITSGQTSQKSPKPMPQSQQQIDESAVEAAWGSRPPMVVQLNPAPPLPPETYLRLTSTAWTAIGSMVGAASLLVLAVFNILYLRRAHEQSVAAREQADIAKKTLDTLQAQILHDRINEFANARAIISRCAVELVLLSHRLKTEYRTGEEQLVIIPDEWNKAVAYISREFPEFHSKMTTVGSSMKALEGEVNQLLRIPFNQRGINSSAGQRIQMTTVSLNKWSAELNDIVSKMSSEHGA